MKELVLIGLAALISLLTNFCLERGKHLWARRAEQLKQKQKEEREALDAKHDRTEYLEQLVDTLRHELDRRKEDEIQSLRDQYAPATGQLKALRDQMTAGRQPQPKE